MSMLIPKDANADQFSELTIDYGDGPNDFCDAYVISGRMNGIELSDAELEEINTECHSLLYELIVKTYY